jgi:inositol-pentakisphosphate 2-kinase
MLDPRGVRRISTLVQESDLCKAMTLRDCTLFLKRSGKGVDARLGDLDLKQPERLSRWKSTEESLITEGWYTNAEDRKLWAKEQICQLSR